MAPNHSRFILRYCCVRHFSFQAGDMVLARATYRSWAAGTHHKHIFPDLTIVSKILSTLHNLQRMCCRNASLCTTKLQHNTTPRNCNTTSKALLQAVSISSPLTRTDQTRNAVQRQQRLTRPGQVYKTRQLEDDFARRYYSIRTIPRLRMPLITARSVSSCQPYRMQTI